MPLVLRIMHKYKKNGRGLCLPAFRFCYGNASSMPMPLCSAAPFIGLTPILFKVSFRHLCLLAFGSLIAIYSHFSPLASLVKGGSVWVSA